MTREGLGCQAGGRPASACPPPGNPPGGPAALNRPAQDAADRRDGAQAGDRPQDGAPHSPSSHCPAAAARPGPARAMGRCNRAKRANPPRAAGCFLRTRQRLFKPAHRPRGPRLTIASGFRTGRRLMKASVRNRNAAGQGPVVQSGRATGPSPAQRSPGPGFSVGLAPPRWVITPQTALSAV